MKKPYITLAQHAKIANTFFANYFPHFLDKNLDSCIESFMTWTGKDMATEFVANNGNRNGQLDPSLDLYPVFSEVEEFLSEVFEEL